MSIAVAQAALAAQQTQTREIISLSALKQQHQHEVNLANMIEEVASAAISASQGNVVDRIA